MPSLIKPIVDFADFGKNGTDGKSFLKFHFLGPHSQAFTGWDPWGPCTGPGVGLDDADGSLPAQDIPQCTLEGRFFKLFRELSQEDNRAAQAIPTLEFAAIESCSS